MTRGWCPSLHEPMTTGDGLLIRVKPPGGVLDTDAARLLASLAARYGNGALELTSRASLQLRGLTPDAVRPVADAVVAAGLACADPAAERRRTVIATPLAPLTMALALERALVADPTLAALPAKFGFLVDEGGPFALRGVSADIVLRARSDGWTVSLDGGRRVVLVTAAIQAALALSHAFLALAPGERRMRTVVEIRGEVAVWTAGEVEAPPSPNPLPLAGEGLGEGDAVGHIPSAHAFVATWPFGTTDAHRLAGLATLAERHGDGTLHLTPWRSLILSGVTADLSAEAAALGCIATPDDPRLHLAACPGQPGCASATVATRTLALRLARPRAGTLHVSGCGKGCAHPGSAALTLVGRDGHWDVVEHGRAGDPPTRRALTPAEILAL